MSYRLEKAEEFERLQRQSKRSAYDYRAELRGLEIAPQSWVLDAGCGSGIVSRYLATTYPACYVIACDASALRITQARAAASTIVNLRFDQEDLRQLSYAAGCFDLIVSRYVVEHQTPRDLKQLVAELVRVLKPGGRLLIIDGDGIMHNLHPQTRCVARGLKRLSASRRIDLDVGRKIPLLLAEAGLTSIGWRIEAMSFKGALKETEIALMRDRLEIAGPFFAAVLGGQEAWEEFRMEYLECMEHPQAVSYFNKFIITGRKPRAELGAGV